MELVSKLKKVFVKNDDNAIYSENSPEGRFEWFDNNAPLVLKVCAGVLGLFIFLISIPFAIWLANSSSVFVAILSWIFLLALFFVWLFWIYLPFAEYKQLSIITFSLFIISGILSNFINSDVFLIMLALPFLAMMFYYGVFASVYWLIEPVIAMTIGEAFKDKMEVAMNEKKKRAEEQELKNKIEALEIYASSIDVVQNSLKGGGSVDQKFLEKNLHEIESLIATDSAVAKFFKGMNYRLKSRQEEHSIKQFDKTMKSIGDMMTTLHNLKQLPIKLNDSSERDKILTDLEIKRQQLEVEKLELEVMQEKLQVQRLMKPPEEEDDD